jgi:hypothetical protein
LLLTAAGLLVLFLTVLNYGRYRLACRQTETALEAAMMSVLSCYQADLAREMGLFALDSRDEDLTALGREYFDANLGAADTFNGMAATDFQLFYPQAGRIAQPETLETQAVEQERLGGVVAMAGDLLSFLGINGGDVWAELAGPGSAAGGADLGGDPNGGVAGGGAGAGPGSDAALQERAAAEAKSGKLKLWHFLLPWPAQGGFSTARLPAGINSGAEAGAAGDDGAELERYLRFWNQYLLGAEAGGEAAEASGASGDLPAGGEGAAAGSLGGDGAGAGTGGAGGAGGAGGEAGESEANEGSGATAGWEISGAAAFFGGFMREFQENLQSALTKGVNKALLGEYILGQMDYATAKPAASRYFAKGEVEYILWRHPNSWDNLRHMALSLFLLRGGIRVIGSLAASGQVNEATIAKALWDGVTGGKEDVERLFAGERIPALPGRSQLTMSYQDHLRLFLFCQSRDSQLRGLRTLLQVNLWAWAGGGQQSAVGAVAPRPEDFGPEYFAAEITAAAEAKMRLWPLGELTVRRSAAAGYDRPFALVR